MANTLFNKGREQFLEGEIQWTTDTIKCILVKSTFSVNVADQKFLSDIGSSYRVGSVSGVTLTSKTATDGAADAADITFSSVSGDTVGSLVLYKDVSGVEGSSPLIAWIDTATGLPITPNGGDIIVTWDNGPNKIFKL